MNTRVGASESRSLSSRTINGFFVNVQATATESVTPGEYNAAPILYGTTTGVDLGQITMKVTLRRGGKEFVLIQDNLGVLKDYNNLFNKTATYRESGSDTAGTEPNSKLRFFVALNGHVNVRDTDELYYECKFNNGAEGTNVSKGTSWTSIEPAYSIGLEAGIPLTRSRAVQANSSRDSVSLGENSSKLAFLVLPGSADLTAGVLQGYSLGSDRLDLSLVQDDAITRHYNQYPPDPSAALDVQPNNLIVLGQDEYVNRGVFSPTMNQSLVVGGRVYICWTQLVSSKRIVARLQQKELEHMAENIAALPTDV